MSRQMQTIVYGCGPAGWLMATALQEAGAAVTLVGPDLDAPWPARYGLWRDQTTGLPEVAKHSWPRVHVIFDDQRRRHLQRSYIRVDGERLKALLAARFEQAGGSVLDARVVQCIGPNPQVIVKTTQGQFEVDLVVAAAGASQLQASAYQTAYGVEATLRSGSLDAMTLMDWRQHKPEHDSDPRPSFLYAMPLPGGKVFVEETALAARPAMPVRVLQSRLEHRLAQYGWELAEADDVEVCTIALDIAVQDQAGHALRFGLAAGMVHPATGYQLAHAIEAAPEVASACVAAFEKGRMGQALIEAGLQALWPPQKRRCHDLYSFGLDVVCQLDTEQTRRFFETFFDLPAATLHGYLDRGLTVGEAARAMLRVFLSTSASLKWELLKAVWRDKGRVSSALWRPNVALNEAQDRVDAPLSSESFAPSDIEMNPTKVE
ncbi:MAG: hypothetical protein CMH53_08765 [Myxococcales bacterium]|nr:hypothetical protein [Myxococcales bacterium]